MTILDKALTAFITMRFKIIYGALRHNNDFAKIKNAIETHEQIDEMKLATLSAFMTTRDITPVMILDKHYPKTYKTMSEPPFVVGGVITPNEQKELYEEVVKSKYSYKELNGMLDKFLKEKQAEQNVRTQ